jgi:hypothetical protein
MQTAKDYWQLALRFDHAAEQARDDSSRAKLRDLADGYFTLARSATILERSKTVVESIRQTQAQMRPRARSGT